MAASDPQARIAMLEQTLAAAQRELNSTSHELHWAHLTIQKKDAVIRLLEERLRKQRIGLLGPGSETLSDLQLELLVEISHRCLPGNTSSALLGPGEIMT